MTVVGAVGCYDFGEAREKCEREGRCDAPPDGGRPDGGPNCPPNDLPDPPDDGFEDTNCDGVDGVAAAGLFVDPENGNDANMGTLASPVQTITQAVALLQGNGRPGVTALYLARGTYNEANLVVNVPVSLYGGYAGRGNWQRDSTHVTHLDGGRLGMQVQNLGDDAGVILDRLFVSSATATVAGTPSIALQISNSRGVVMRYSTLSAGQGAPGSRGNDGLGGADGGSGDAGTTANQASPGIAGAAGVSLCQGVDHGGGGGRNGGSENPGLPGIAGKPAPPLGGTGGTGGAVGAPTPATATRYDCTAGSGDAGTPGTRGDAGVPGQSGMGMGMLSGNTWVATLAGNGTAGRNGSGGGGGGSGGGCPLETNNNLTGAAGGGSGGGGGGGCGGGGGGGGSGGGASIAVLLIGSDVRFEGPVVLKTAGGGRGGEGGEGGSGGLGGRGGPGGGGGVLASSTSGTPTISYFSTGGSGGPGGNGGNGGAGGPGGGGGGGPSVGVWCGPNSGYTGSVQDLLGLAGQGGPGGTGGNTGANGLKALSQGCPTLP